MNQNHLRADDVPTAVEIEAMVVSDALVIPSTETWEGAAESMQGESRFPESLESAATSVRS